MSAPPPRRPERPGIKLSIPAGNVRKSLIAHVTEARLRRRAGSDAETTPFFSRDIYRQQRRWGMESPATRLSPIFFALGADTANPGTE